VKKFSNIFLVTIALFSLSACNKGDGSGMPAFGYPVALNVTPFQKDGCLDLESLVSYLNKPGFKMKARKTTLDYSQGSSRKSLFIQNFGIKHFIWAGFPMISSVKQHSCTSAEIMNSYGRSLAYQITSHSKQHLELDLIPSTDIVDESIPFEPKIDKLRIEIKGANGIEITQKTTTPDVLCDHTRSYSFDKRTLYEWETPRARFLDEVPVSDQLLAKAQSLVGSGTATQPASANGIFAVAAVMNVQQALDRVHVGHACD
jgi:hypothetical protein